MKNLAEKIEIKDFDFQKESTNSYLVGIRGELLYLPKEVTDYIDGQLFISKQGAKTFGITTLIKKGKPILPEPKKILISPINEAQSFCTYITRHEEIKPLALAPLVKNAKPVTKVFLNGDLIFTGIEREVLKFLQVWQKQNKWQEIQKDADQVPKIFGGGYKDKPLNTFTFETL